jgi:uncharacterized protein (TIGR02996 family)
MPRVRVLDGVGECILEMELERRLTIGSKTTSVDIALGGLRPVHAWIELEGETVTVYSLPLARLIDPGDTQPNAPGIARQQLRPPRDAFQLDDYTIEVDAIPGTRNYEPGDATEAELIAALRADPLDDATREVYADWLEQHDFPLRAKLLRAETEAARPGIELVVRLDRLAPPGDEAWRAVASRAAVERCGIDFRFRCPKAWSELALTGDDRIRHCSTCEREVHYCTSIDEARTHGRRGRCIAIDAAVARGEALEAYDGHTEIEMGDIEPLEWGPGSCGEPDADD